MFKDDESRVDYSTSSEDASPHLATPSGASYRSVAVSSAGLSYTLSSPIFGSSPSPSGMGRYSSGLSLAARRFFRHTNSAPRRAPRARSVAATEMPAIAAVERPNDGLEEAGTVGGSLEPRDPDVRGVVGGVSLDRLEGEDVAVAADVGNRSDAFHAIWIMGAKMLRLNTAALGMVAKLKPSKRPLRQVTVLRVMVRTTARHVWPFWLWQLKPGGQHPTAVSPGSMGNCIAQSAVCDGDEPKSAVA